MSLEAEHIDDEMFQQADEDYSYAKQNLGTNYKKISTMPKLGRFKDVIQ